MTRHLIAVAAATLLLSACAHHAHTYPIRWQLYGTVESVSDTRFRVRHKDGHHVDLVIDDETVFEKDHRPATLQAMQHRSRVIVEVETLGDGTAHARHVQISGGGEPW